MVYLGEFGIDRYLSESGSARLGFKDKRMYRTQNTLFTVGLSCAFTTKSNYNMTYSILDAYHFKIVSSLL